MGAAVTDVAAPPPAGSMRWYAWLFTPHENRPVVAALFAIEAELQSIVATRVDHGVAHLKLHWWREEFLRLEQGAARHPLTLALARALPVAADAWHPLQELVNALELDLAGATFESEPELDAYLALADGLCRALTLALAHAHGQRLQAMARAAGQAVRSVEFVRDLRQDAIDGRIRLPLEWLAEHALTHVDLRGVDAGPAARACLRRLAARARRQAADADARLDQAAAPELRGLRVLLHLHVALLDHIERKDFAIGSRRISTGPLSRLWTAWRAARQHGRP